MRCQHDTHTPGHTLTLRVDCPVRNLLCACVERVAGDYLPAAAMQLVTASGFATASSAACIVTLRKFSPSTLVHFWPRTHSCSAFLAARDPQRAAADLQQSLLSLLHVASGATRIRAPTLSNRIHS